MAETKTASNFGEILLREGLLTKPQLEKAMKEAEISERPLSRILVEAGVITEGVKIGILEKRLNCQVMTIFGVTPRPEVADLIPAELCKRHGFVPIRMENGKIVVAMEDPTDLRALGALETLCPVPVQAVLSKSGEIGEAIKRLPRISARTAAGPGFWHRTLRTFTLPAACLLPLAAFLYLWGNVNAFRDLIREVNFDPFERVLFVVLGWCGWAIIAFWANALVFGTPEKKSKED